MPTFDDAANLAADRMLETGREFYGYIITSSGVLISVPLVALAILAGQSSISRIDVGIVAALVLTSAIMFSASLLFTLMTHYGVVMSTVYGFANLILSSIPPEQAKSFDKQYDTTFMKDLANLRKESKRFYDGFDYANKALWAFVAGIVLLLVSLGSMVLILA